MMERASRRPVKILKLKVFLKMIQRSNVLLKQDGLSIA